MAQTVYHSEESRCRRSWELYTPSTSESAELTAARGAVKSSLAPHGNADAKPTI